MVNNIVFHKFPHRKNKFKKMVAEVWSRGPYNWKSRQMLLLKDSVLSNESSNWLSKNPKRWNDFRNGYKEEFEEKIRLLDQIKHKKRHNEVFYLIESTDFVN